MKNAFMDGLLNTHELEVRENDPEWIAQQRPLAEEQRREKVHTLDMVRQLLQQPGVVTLESGHQRLSDEANNVVPSHPAVRLTAELPLPKDADEPQMYLVLQGYHLIDRDKDEATVAQELMGLETVNAKLNVSIRVVTEKNSEETSTEKSLGFCLFRPGVEVEHHGVFIPLDDGIHVKDGVVQPSATKEDVKLFVDLAAQQAGLLPAED